MKHSILALCATSLIMLSGSVLAQSGKIQQGVNADICKAIGGTKNNQGDCIYGNIRFNPTKGKNTCNIIFISRSESGDLVPKGEVPDKSLTVLHKKTCTKLIKETFPHAILP